MTEHGTRTTLGETYLIVDDHAGFRRALRSFIPGEAFRVIECSNGREAIESYERHRPDWVVMSFDLSEEDVISAARSLRSKYPEVQIIIISQHDSVELRRRAGDVGAIAYVKKDQLEHLQIVLTSLLKKSCVIEDTASLKQ